MTTTIETYADSGDYTYPATTERLLVQSVNWPGDVNQALLAQQAENVRLEECNAWLEGELANLRGEVDALKAKVGAIGRNLSRVIRKMESK